MSSLASNSTTNRTPPPQEASGDFQKLIENLTSALCVVSKAGIILFVNPAAEKLFAQPKTDLVGKAYPFPLHEGETIEIEISQPSEEIIHVETCISQTQWQGETAFLVSLQNISKAKRAQQAAEARAAELDMLWFFAETLNQAATLEEVLQSGLQTGIGLLNATQGWIILVDETGLPYLAASHNLPIELQTWYEREPLHCQCVTQLISNELTLPTFISNCEFFGQSGETTDHLTEHLAVPLHIGNRSVGILNLRASPSRTFTQDEYRLLKTIGDQVGVAIERARLFAETQDALHREQRLTEVTRAISSALDLGVILGKVINLTIELVKADIGGLGLLIPNTDKIVSPYLFSADKRTTGLKNLPAGENLARYMIKTGKTISWSIMETAINDEITQLSKELTTAGVFGVIGAPITAGEACLGAILLYILSPTKRFIQRNLTLIDSVGRQAGIAIQNARLYEEIQQMATTDPLTGLYNRRSFFPIAQQQIETALRYNHHLSAMMLDIDHFKKVNDTYGHSIGDRVLQKLAAICLEELRQADILCRYGGEEILIIMPGTNLTSAAKAAERLRQRIEATPFAADGNSLSITISLGVATLETPTDPANDSMTILETIINNADEALYQSKEAGRNRVSIFRSDKEPLEPSTHLNA